MASIKDHYENFLAPNYVWAFGGYEANAQKFRALMDRFKIEPKENASVVDLGCGPGYQSIALTDSGYDVMAFDMSHVLLNELRQRMGNRNISVVEDDIQNFQEHCAGKNIELIICVGDVLAHLQSMPDVAMLFKKVFDSLQPGGKFLISFRDQTHELKGTERIIPFYSDENKIMTTFLEYSEEYVTVTDVIYERAGSEWSLEKSQYQKLRLRTERIMTLLVETGFEVFANETMDGFTNVLVLK